MQLPSKPREFGLWVDGQQTASSDGDWIERESPGHAVPVTRVPAGTTADVDRAVTAARVAFDEGPWPWTASSERAAILTDVARRVRAASDELAYWETLESGKPISQARAEVEWTAGLWEYAAALSRHLYGDSCNTLGRGTLAMTLRDPIGVVGLITPWNFPMLIISQKLPFALAAGCTCVIKPSELTSATTLLLAEICDAAGVPSGVINVITGYGEPVGRRIAEHDDVDMVSFTGSTAVGKAIVRAAAGNLKKVSLELGGKNPMIVMDDADLDAAVDAGRLGAFFNMRECCNASSRILVQEGIADAFVERLTAFAAELQVGDPLEKDSKLGAIINETQEQTILGYLQAGQAAGATVCMGGGTMATQTGRFLEVTVLDHVPADCSVAKEEVFGPVLSIVRFKTLEEAIAIACLAEGVDVVSNLNIRLATSKQKAGTLSGGNQQKVVLAKWLEADSQVIIFDEPTRGIDVGAKYDIYLLINELASRGKAIVIISSELPEILGMSDRILVMHEGRVTGDITDVEHATQDQIVNLAIQ